MKWLVFGQWPRGSKSHGPVQRYGDAEDLAKNWSRSGAIAEIRSVGGYVEARFMDGVAVEREAQ